MMSMPFIQYMTSEKEEKKSYIYVQHDSDNATKRTLVWSGCSCIKSCIFFPACFVFLTLVIHNNYTIHSAFFILKESHRRKETVVLLN